MILCAMKNETVTFEIVQQSQQYCHCTPALTIRWTEPFSTAHNLPIYIEIKLT